MSALSFTCARSGGTSSANAVPGTHTSNTSSSCASRARTREAVKAERVMLGLASELHFWRFVRAGRGLERGAHRATAHRRTNARGEALHEHVVLTHRLDVALARDRDAILGT